MNPFLKMFLIFVVAPLGLGLLVFIVLGILGAKEIDEENAKTIGPYEKKYKDRNVLGEYTLETLYQELARLGKEALRQGDWKAAREYLEDSLALKDIESTQVLMMECYAVAGEREKAAAILEREMKYQYPDEKILFRGIALGLADAPLTVLEKGRAAAKRHGYIKDDVYEELCAAQKRLAQDALASYGDTLQQAQQLAREGDPAGAAALCRGAYDMIADHIEKSDRPKYQPALTELAWQMAVYCCATDAYQQYELAETYLNKEKDCTRYPTYYYIHMLAKTRGGVSGFDDPHFLYKAAYEYVDQAIREGLPGAKKVEERLQKTALRSAEIEADNALFEVEQMEAEEAFEEAHGMSREEYAERQKELAEERARAKREQKLREKFEWEERYHDLLSGGSGHSMEEKVIRGEISYSDHERYREAKEKYIKKKSE